MKNRYELNENTVRSIGFVDQRPTGYILNWSASGVIFYTNSHEIYMEIEGIDCENGEDSYAYLAIYIDEAESYAKKLKVFRGLHLYQLYENNDCKRHKITIIKLTEEQYDKVELKVLYLDANSYVEADCMKQSAILFIGDSITAGYGVHGIDGISTFTTADEDATKSYAFLTSRELNMEAFLIADSGNGIISRYIEKYQEEANTFRLLPNIYPYNYNVTPQIIICNLGTNDSSYTRDIFKKKREFEKEYKKFLEKISLRYPEARIIVVYGLMEKTLHDTIQTVVNELSIEYIELPLQDKKDGIAAAGHPSIITHEKAAKIITDKLRTGIT